MVHKARELPFPFCGHATLLLDRMEEASVRTGNVLARPVGVAHHAAATRGWDFCMIGSYPEKAA